MLRHTQKLLLFHLQAFSYSRASSASPQWYRLCRSPSSHSGNLFFIVDSNLHKRKMPDGVAEWTAHLGEGKPMRGSDPRQTLLQGIATLCAFSPALVCLVWFQWYLECGFIKTLDKHWTHPVCVCSALHFRGLRIVAVTTLQIFVGTVKGQARVWDQVLKLTEAPPQLCPLPLPSPLPREIVLLNFS